MCCRFAKVSISSYEHSKQHAANTHVPLFGSNKYINVADLFCSNLTFTYDGFSNVQHKDKDDNDYTFGMWFPVHSKGTFYGARPVCIFTNRPGFKLVTHAENPWSNVSGGQFIWSQYEVGADFMKCDGITMLIWSEKHSLHGTVRVDVNPPSLNSPFTLLGTSLQIAKYLVTNVNLYMERKEQGDNQHVIADMEYQLNKMK